MKNCNKDSIRRCTALFTLTLLIWSHDCRASGMTETTGKMNGLLSAGDIAAIQDDNESTWVRTLPVDSFVKVRQLSGDNNYYSVLTNDENWPYIHSHYMPLSKVVRYGYQLPDTLDNVKHLSWLWRVSQPPSGADERKNGKNDSGCAVYLVFKDNLKTYMVKYVYSSVVPEGTVIRMDPMYPIQQMRLIVASTWTPDGKNRWKQVTVDICADFCRVYGTQNCPELKGIGILSDGDGTKSEVIADYAQFVLTGVKK